VAVINDLDTRVAGIGAIVILAISVPPAVVIAALKSSDVVGRESNLWVIAAVAILVAFAAGGVIAGRRRPDMPYIHSAAAAIAAELVLLAYAVVRHAVEHRTTSWVSLALLFQIGISLSLLGGHFSQRRQAARNR
jgi:predicted permease